MAESPIHPGEHARIETRQSNVLKNSMVAINGCHCSAAGLSPAPDLERVCHSFRGTFRAVCAFLKTRWLHLFETRFCEESENRIDETAHRKVIKK
jgi:hypothetical protein